MKAPTINTHDLMIVYQQILDKMYVCTDEMMAALKNENVDMYSALSNRYDRLRVMRTHYLQRIEMIKEILEEMEDIAEEVSKI